MPGICLIAAGASAAYLATAEFTLRWRHSVEHVRWEERYRLDGARLTLVEASVEAMGAGMEPGPDARLVDGRWIWTPALPPQSELTLAMSDFAGDYDICIEGSCRTLGALAPMPSGVVVVRPCDGGAPPREP
jgi:hypothetical protein